MRPVVDLTGSPLTDQGNMQHLGQDTNHGTQALSISSDEEDRVSSVRLPVVAQNRIDPHLRLPPIHLDEGPNRGGERILTLREILRTRRNNRRRNRGESQGAQQPNISMNQGGNYYNTQSGTGASSIAPTAIGVGSATDREDLNAQVGADIDRTPIDVEEYHPIRATPLLPSQRRRRHNILHGETINEDDENNATGGRVINVESVDDSHFNEEIENYHRNNHMITDDDMEDSEDSDAVSDSDQERYWQFVFDTINRNIYTRMSSSQTHPDRWRHRTSANNSRVAINHFNPALHRLGMHFGTNPFDFFPDENLTELLSVLDATTPAPPSRPRTPLPPLKLTKKQEELEASDGYTRKVPAANYRDSESVSPESMEIVCTFCDSTLYSNTPIWASKCGHVFCNECVEGITGASKKCKACNTRVIKKSLAHLFI